MLRSAGTSLHPEALVYAPCPGWLVALVGRLPHLSSCVIGYNALSILKAQRAGTPRADPLCNHLAFCFRYLASFERAPELLLDFSLTQMKNWVAICPI